MHKARMSARRRGRVSFFPGVRPGQLKKDCLIGLSVRIGVKAEGCTSLLRRELLLDASL